MTLPSRNGAFTLIELLIVLTIIAILSSLTVAGARVAKKKATRAATNSDIQAFQLAIAAYVSDVGVLPGMTREKRGDSNDFPRLFEAVMGVPRSQGGKGGPAAPYWDSFDRERVLVYDSDSSTYVRASSEQLYDTSVAKYYGDRWGNPYFYRCNVGQPAIGWHPTTYDVWSFGADGVNDSLDPAAADDDDYRSDDIGNW